MTFGTINAALVQTGACLAGYAKVGGQSPTLACDAGGNWAESVTNPCQRTSPRPTPLHALARAA